LEGKLRAFAEYVRMHPGANTQEMATHFGVSERTVRNWLRAANGALGPSARVVSDGGTYTLQVSDDRAYTRLVRGGVGAWDLSNALSSAEQRTDYLLYYLLSQSDWVTLDDLAEMLYVTRRTISTELREVEERLVQSGLALERRPHYGIRVNGDETARRQCLVRLLAGTASVQPSETDFSLSFEGGMTVGELDDCIGEAVSSYGLELSSVARQNLLVHLSIALERVSRGSYVPMPAEQLAHIQTAPEYPAAQALATLVSQRSGVELPPEEAAYICIHLAAKRSIDAATAAASDGVIISDEVWAVVLEMLEEVQRSFRFDLFSDLELRMNLATHVMPLALRLRHHLNLENPLLDDIKLSYPLAYSMAGVAGGVLERHYGHAPSEDELGYLAMLFALALERNRTWLPKKRIVVVCASGQGSARLLEMRYRKEFGDCIESVVAIDASRARQLDFSQVDYLFTTVPLRCEVPVPVREVEFFLSDVEIGRLRDELRGASTHPSAPPAFASERLYVHLPFATKEEVLGFLCDRAEALGAVDEDFRELVWQRERSMPTTFGNLVAMPHPLRAAGAQTLVWVGLLDKPVPWNEKGTEVQAVFLISFGRDDDRHGVEDLFGTLAELFIDEVAIPQLLRKQSWECLERLLA